VARFILPLPDSVALEMGGSAPDLAISRDGRLIVHQSRSANGPYQFNLRSLEQLESTPLRGGENGASPFFSYRWAQNGRELFFQDDPAQPSMRMVEYEATDVFRFEAPVLLFDSPGWSGSQPFGEPFDVEPGDERFIVAVTAGSVGGDAGQRPAVRPREQLHGGAEAPGSVVNRPRSRA
jgi:hypothetical protein